MQVESEDGGVSRCLLPTDTVRDLYQVTGTIVEGAAEIRVWVGALRCCRTAPTQQALREILYGDPDNSADGVDVVALYLSEMSPAKGLASLSGVLYNSLHEDDRDSYIFNDVDAGQVGSRGPPVQLSWRGEGEADEYCGMYACVHKRLAIDTNRHAGISIEDVFPFPPVLTCGVPLVSGRSQNYSMRESVMLLDVLVASPFDCESQGPVALLLCGANLSDDFSLQLGQLEHLNQAINIRRHETPFTVVIFGRLSHWIVLGSDFANSVDLAVEAKVPKEKKDKKGKKDKNKEKRNSAQYELNDDGIARVCRMFDDPVVRRTLICKGSSLGFSGTDCFGMCHSEPHPCAELLSELFYLSCQWVIDSSAEVPLPTNLRTSMATAWSQKLGFELDFQDMVTAAMANQAVKNLRVPENSPEDLLMSYFPSSMPQEKAHARVLKDNLGDALYMQAGWMDALGVLKQSRDRRACPSKLLAWDAHSDIFAFDHVPVTGSVELAPEGRDVSFRVWVGSVKLDGCRPTRQALRELLYGTECNSAQGADVIALFLTDLNVTETIVKQLHGLLADCLKEDIRDQYIFNADAQGLVLKGIPAQLMRWQDGRNRYVALTVAVHKQHMGDSDGDGMVQLRDVYPEPPELICRSDMKNDHEPSFKGHMAQEVVLRLPQRADGLAAAQQEDFLVLMLIGLNFDTDDAARARQAERLMQYLARRHRAVTNCSAIIFGDFNSRLVCPHWLREHVKWDGEGEVKKPVLSVEGAKEVCSKFATLDGRRDMMRTLSADFFNGLDAAGAQIDVPAVCKVLRQDFELYTDLVSQRIEWPLPTYKRTPIGSFLSELAGFKLTVKDLLTRKQLERGLIALRAADVWTELQSFSAACCTVQSQRRIRCYEAPSIQGSTIASVGVCPQNERPSQVPTLACGWPDIVGVYRWGKMVNTNLLKWGTCEAVLGSLESIPIRATVTITAAPSGRSTIPKKLRSHVF